MFSKLGYVYLRGLRGMIKIIFNPLQEIGGI